ncbi:MAG: sulfatase [Planctomycetota bacterium]|nr:sulfatase [Planctomycetota bacterium]
MVAAIFPPAIRAAEMGNRPNVLFICADDLKDWLGCLGGHPDVKTPNIDRLARRGMLFTNAHCPATTCNPSRVATMTGLWPSTTGIYGNAQWFRPLLPDAVTIPQHFRTHGYRVVGGGKVFHSGNVTDGFNPPDQWHEYFELVRDNPWHHPFKGLNWPKGFPLNELENVKRGVAPPSGPSQFDWGPFDKTDLEMGDGQMVGWAIDFLSRQHDRPFFLAAGIYRPHLPWYAPRKYFDLYPIDNIRMPPRKADDLDDVPRYGQQLARDMNGDEFDLVVATGTYRSAVQAYLASISYVDALVGRLVAALDNSRHADNTIIVFWSDHGWHLGEKGHWHKTTLWEEATRVPLIVVAPDVTRPDLRCSRPASLVDIYPTLIDLCRLTRKQELDGMSLTPWLRDPEMRRERPVLSTRGYGNHALRSDRWRYIRYADFHGGGEELYDHQTDANEWHNLAADPKHAAVKQDLARWLPKKNTPNAPGTNAFDFDPETWRWKRKKRAIDN